MDRIKAITLNVNGLRGHIKRSALFEYFKSQQYDIMFLQETHSQVKDETKWSEELEWGHAIWNSYNSQSAGVGIIINTSKNNVKFLGTKYDNKGRILAVNLEIMETRFTLVNIYAYTSSPRVKNSQRVNFFVEMCKYLVTSYNLILAGDFNITIDPNNDKRPSNSKHPFLQNTLKKIVQNFHLEDTFRATNPKVKEFTFHHALGAARLDRIYISNLTIVDKAYHLSIPWADHDAAVLEINLKSIEKRGPGMWRNNTGHYNDKIFLQEFEDHWRKWITLKEYMNCNWIEWWINIKTRIKKLLIKFGARVRRRKKEEKERLEIQLDETRIRLNRGEKVLSQIIQIKSKIIKEQSINFESIRMKSKIDNLTPSSKNLQFFFSKIKKRHKLTEIKSLRDSKSIVQSKIKEKLDIVERFYSSLYKRKDTCPKTQEFFISYIKRVLTEQQKDQLKEDLSIPEIKKVISEIKPNKSPGPDGISIEFYKSCYHIIEKQLQMILNEMYSTPDQTETANGVIHLIFKRGDNTDINNYRPITLLNYDLKILNKILSNRTKNILPDITHPHQFSKLPNKIIDLNLLLREITADTRNQKLGSLISLDFQKAFDSIDHGFMFATLHKYGMPIKFISYIKAIYSGPKSKILVNGHLSKKITLQRGVRQGDPLSNVLFTLTTDSLLQAINEDRNIHGIRLQGIKEEIKTPAFADDTAITTRDELSAKRAIDMVKLYGNASGMVLNLSKSKGLCFARNQYDLQINWVNSVQIVGIRYGNVVNGKAWNDKINECKEILHNIGHRSYNLEERKTIIKSIILPKMLYLAQTEPLGPKHKYQIRKITQNFLLPNREDIDFNILTLAKSEGGIDLPNIPLILDLQLGKIILQHLQKLHGDIEQDKSIYSRIDQQIGLSMRNYIGDKFNNSKPHTITPLMHWKKTLDIIKKYEIDINEIRTTPIRAIYDRIIHDQKPKYAGKLMTTKWENVTNKLLSQQEMILNWKCAHSILPTRAKYRVRMASGTDLCPWCHNRTETERHLFNECKEPAKLMATAIWIWAESNKTTAPPVTTKITIEYNFGRSY